MRCRFWPGSDEEHAAEIARYLAGDPPPLLDHALLAFDGERAVGLAELSIRYFAEGCDTRNVGYLEGWYVEPGSRESGVGRALMTAAEDWCRARGCREMGSDTTVDNTLSRRAHRACGFEEAELICCFRKSL